jgi:hypothetical protein
VSTEDLTEQQQTLLKIVAGLVPATAGQVGRALGELSMDLQRITDQLAEADEESTRLSEDYGLAYDMAFIEAGEGSKPVSIAVREATARIETAQLRLDAEVAKLRVRQLKNAHKTLDRRIDVGRTCAATVRSEHRTIGYGQSA